MKTSPAMIRGIGVLAGALALLVSCQSTDPAPSSSAQTITVPLALGAVSRIPDSLAWRSPTANGSKKVVCPSVSCPQVFELKSPLEAKDTFHVDVWKWGVFVGTAKFLSLNGSTTLKAVASTANSLSVNLLESFASFKSSKDSLANANASDLVSYYARLLLDSSTAYPGVIHPVGMSESGIKQAVVLLAAKRGLTNTQLQAKGIAGLPTDSVRLYVSVLVEAKRIPDTTALFPVSPLWIQTAFSVGNLTQGEGPVAVTGAFGWKTPRSITVSAEIRNAQGREDSVEKAFKDTPKSSDGSFVLTNNLTLQANMGARIGTDTLVVTLSDDSGHVVTARAPFQVLRGDTVAPKIALVAPAFDTSVDNSVSSFVLRVDVSDNKKVARVKIGSKTFDAPPYLDTVDLAVGGNIFDIEAWDASGNASTLKVVILRANPAIGGDTTDPVVQLVAPAADIEVPFTTDTVELSWTATDDAGLAKVTLDDAAIAGASGAFKAKRSLKVGANDFSIKAYDSAGNTAGQSIRVTRLPDPVAAGMLALADRSVPFEQDTAFLAWTLYNPQKALSVSLDGTTLIPSGNTASKSVALAVGANPFVLTVKDSSGKLLVDTVVVTRAADARGPAIQWVSPTKPHSVEATTTSYVVKIKVTDPSGVDSVHLQGAKAKEEGEGIWSMEIPLPRPDGSPIAVRAQAWDKKKNMSIDTTMSITREVPDGTEKPTIVLVKPTTATGNTLVYDSATLHVEARITGLVAIDPATVFFNTTAATKSGDVYSANVPVPATGTAFTITIKAANTAKNGSTFELVVTRAKDTIPPVITPSPTTKNQTVPFETKTFDLSWSLADNDSLASVKFNGSLEPITATLKKTVNLAVGTDTFTLVATDRSGNSSASRVILTRDGDRIAPVVAIENPSADTTVPNGTASIAVRTQASDVGSGIKSVTVNGVLVDKNGVANVALTANQINLITAIATDSAGNADTATVNVTVMGIVATPTFTPIAGTYTTAQTVTIASATSGATVYYTTDGAAPTTASLLYSTPIAVSGSQTIKAMAVKAGLTNSAVGTADFIIKPLAGTPTFSPLPSITYQAAQSVTITSTTSGASIYYTKDGSTPTSSSTLYTGPLTLGSSDTLRAIAVKPGLTNSAVETAIYSIFDVTLKSVVLNGTMNVPVIGANLRSDSLAALSDVAIHATPTDSSASVTMSFVSPIKMISAETTVLITVKKGTASRAYTLALIPRRAGTFKDTRDSNTYRAVKIGSQWWMAQNLNYAGPKDTLGTCYRDSCDRYGRGYLSVNDVLSGASPSTKNPSGVQGICPSGWHLPSHTEWVALLLAAGGGSDTAGGLKKLKSKASTYAWTSTTRGPGPTSVPVVTDNSGTDDYGFTMLPLQGYGTGSSSGSYSTNFAGFFTSSSYIQFTGTIATMPTTTTPRMPVRCRLD